MVSVLNGQALVHFLGHWTGVEELDSPSMTYDNRNISIVIDEGGDRDGFYIYTSSCDFLYNEDLDWAYHYFGFDKDSDQVIFLRRFITPLGVLGYEELIYDLTEWSTEYFVAEYLSNDGLTLHQIRMDIDLLKNTEPLPLRMELSQNFPNPFNPATNIYVSVDLDSEGSLVIYDVNGQVVKRLHEGRFSQGIERFTWDGLNDQGRSASAGVYLCRLLINGSFIRSQKMTLVK
jgi:hypothetical protein